MVRNLSVITSKNIPIAVAGENMTRGMAVVQNHADGTVKKANGEDEIFLVDVAMNYDGINAVVNPTDKDFETIKTGDKVLLIPVQFGESYATTEVTATGLGKGDYLKTAAGKFIKATTGDKTGFVYADPYSDPTGLTMYEIKRVDVKTV